MCNVFSDTFILKSMDLCEIIILRLHVFENTTKAISICLLMERGALL